MDIQSIFMLGRQPAIGRAELESLYGPSHMRRLGDQAVGIEVPPADVIFERLGGAVRLAKPLAELPSTKWPDIARYLTEQLPQYISLLPEGKLKMGLSVFGLPVSTQQLFRTGLELKKACKHAGRSARIVPNEGPELSSAQVLHNQLTGELGMELLLIKHGSRTWVAQTVRVQDINAYAKRDQGRPKRDARVGMLPPKLAQTIVNLATGPLPAQIEHIVLDPFCGTGVVLQEAALMGYNVYGTDLESRMIDYTADNLEWLGAQHAIHPPTLQVGDATNYTWHPGFSVVASETYLGRPLSSWPSPDKLQEIIGTCNTIIEKFLVNMADQTPRHLRLCLAVPAWRSPNGAVRHLPLLDRLGDLGYNRVSFEHAAIPELIYARPDQLVARELLVITRK